MLKKPLAVVVILSLALLATPVMATAGTWTNAPRISSPLFTDLFEAWTSFWGSLLGGEEAPSGASLLDKGNGCGIDPNGLPLCGGLTGATPDSDPGETQGSGN